MSDSDPKSVEQLLGKHYEGHWRTRAETAEKVGRHAEVELLEMRRRMAQLEELLGETRLLLREARINLGEVIAERDALQARFESRARLLVVSPEVAT